MNYLGIIALCLGVISLLITVQYMNNIETIEERLTAIQQKLSPIYKDSEIKNKVYKLIIELQQDTGLSIEKLKNKILSYKSDMAEGFISSRNYISTENRGIEQEKALKYLDYNKIEKLANIAGDYSEIFDLAIKQINKMDIKDKKSLIKNVNKLFVNNNKAQETCPKKQTSTSLSCSSKPKWCHMKHHNNTYCFQVSNKNLCSNGKLKNSSKNCQFY